MRKKDAAICLCVIFLDPVNELLFPAHGLEFDAASFRKGANGRYIKKRKMGKTMEERRMAQPTQKLKSEPNYVRKRNIVINTILMKVTTTRRTRQ
jgi:hypothetical protein